MYAKKSIRTVAALVAGLSALALGSNAAEAASFHNGNYGALAHENAYPGGNHACGLSGWVQAVPAQAGSYGGRTYTIRLCYNGSYGAYARLDGAAVNDSHCYAILDRSNSPHETTSFSSVWETVDGGVGYAYTKIGNDLDGRLARAAVICGRTSGDFGGVVIARTAWY